jgi:hypothetical protein
LKKSRVIINVEICASYIHSQEEKPEEK